MEEEIIKLEKLFYFNRENKDVRELYEIELGKQYRELMFKYQWKGL